MGIANGHGSIFRLGFLLSLGAAAAFAGCSSSDGSTSSSSGSTSNKKKDAGASTHADASQGSNDTTPTGDDTAPAGDDATPTGDDAAPAGDDAAQTSDAPTGDDAPALVDGPLPPPACVKGQVTKDEVVMIGDSYLDPVWSNAAVDLYADAKSAGLLTGNDTYRHYYIGAASMAWGNPNGNDFYIPDQYEKAKTDIISTPTPKDIKVVIMDGGGNDVLIGNTSCETTAPPGNTSCVDTIKAAVDKAKSLMVEANTDGVKQIVYFFYPHLDPKGGGILQTPAPTVNDTLDYAYPLAENVCCGSSFSSSLSNFYCSGEPAPGTKCYFVDTRPAFEGHLSDYIKDDHVHPTPAGAKVIADLIWKVMVDNCIAQ